MLDQNLKEVLVKYKTLDVGLSKVKDMLKNVARIDLRSDENENYTRGVFFDTNYKPGKDINVSSSDIEIVLNKYLKNKITAVELEDWASFILLMNETYNVCFNDSEQVQEIALYILHKIAMPETVRGFTIDNEVINYFIDCIQKGEIPTKFR